MTTTFPVRTRLVADPVAPGDLAYTQAPLVVTDGADGRDRGGTLLGAAHGRNAVPSQWRRLVLTCRPITLPLPANPIKRPRPRSLWPVDVEALAERLLLAGR